MCNIVILADLSSGFILEGNAMYVYMDICVTRSVLSRFPHMSPSQTQNIMKFLFGSDLSASRDGQPVPLGYFNFRSDLRNVSPACCRREF
jgi:hypothetical protein